MAELSPEAQAVLDAVLTDNLTGPERFWARAHAASALRAAADLVVPQGGPFLMTASEDRVRHQLLAIAAELEGGAGTSSTHLEAGE